MRAGLKSNQKVMLRLDNQEIIKIRSVADRSVMSSYGAVDPGKKSTSPEVAIKKARFKMAKEILGYE